MTPPPEKKFDVAVLGPPTDDGEGTKVLRLRPEGAAIGEVRPVKEGKPLTGDVVLLKPREGSPRVCDVDVAYSPAEATAAPAAGPPKVTTRAYRDNWDRIFGDREPSGPLN